ncbi:hypothetical protein K1719_008564 [Acacia pycnantha]|nr:hypothetical protein K1719_008564 [Acacia pycnantha]
MSSAAAGARSFIRSAASRTFRKANMAGGARISRSTCSPFSIPKRNSHSNPMFRSPVELSCCVETMIPYHTASVPALLTSMLSVSRRGWNPKDG